MLLLAQPAAVDHREAQLHHTEMWINLLCFEFTCRMPEQGYAFFPFLVLMPNLLSAMH